MRSGVLLAGMGLIGALLFLLLPWFQLSRGGRSLAAGNAEQAAVFLLQAVERLPESAFAWRRLAQAELMRGDPAAVVVALEQAYALTPTDPLVLHELALAHEAAGDYTAADAQWQALGIDPDKKAVYGSAAFSSKQYAAAVPWFVRTLRTGGALDPVQQFQFGVAAVLTNAAEAVPLAGPYTPQVEPAGRVPGAQLRWITAHPRYSVASGAFLTQEAGSGAGVLFWNGAAVVVLDNTHTGRAFLRIRARHSRPAPIRLAVELQGRRIGGFDLDRGTAQSLSHTLLVDTTAGPQAVVITFLNDGAVDGVDRNAVIEWVELIPAN